MNLPRFLMRRLLRPLVIALLGGALPVFAQTAGSEQPAMIIKGDQEAPLVLYIVPWQEPKAPEPPAVLRQALIPPVLDDNGSLVDDPINRSTTLRPPSKAGNDDD